MSTNISFIVPRFTQESELVSFDKNIKASIEDLLTRAEPYSVAENKAIDRNQGLFLVSSITYGPCELEQERILIRMFGEKYLSNPRYKEMNDGKKLIESGLDPFVISQPTAGMQPLVGGEFLFVNAGQYNYGMLKLGEIAHSIPGFVEYNRDNIVPALSMYPNPHMIIRANNLNKEDRRVSFHTRDVLGSEWSIHCNFPK